FNAWSHLVSLAFCQFACRVSLRESSVRLRPALPQPLRPSLGLVTGEQSRRWFRRARKRRQTIHRLLFR
ncbi:DUF4372 domain-containing protein, partial [Prevotella sp. S7-1-8]|uniref:DUF4372 domain-containing protein n=1 Tax=Prevotella sp. S7-1-8 TaxID=1284775 RepID=UPI0012E012CF